MTALTSEEIYSNNVFFANKAAVHSESFNLYNPTESYFSTRDDAFTCSLDLQGNNPTERQL